VRAAYGTLWIMQANGSLSQSVYRSFACWNCIRPFWQRRFTLCVLLNTFYVLKDMRSYDRVFPQFCVSERHACFSVALLFFDVIVQFSRYSEVPLPKLQECLRLFCTL